MAAKHVKRAIGALVVGATATLVAMASASADPPPVNPPNPIDHVQVTEETDGYLFPLCFYVTVNSASMGEVVDQSACVGN